MWRWLERWFPPEPAPSDPAAPAWDPNLQAPLPADLTAATAVLKQILDHAPDAVFRPFDTGGGVHGLLLFMLQLADSERLEKEVLKVIQQAPLQRADLPADAAGLADLLSASVLPSVQMQAVTTVGNLIGLVLRGQAAFVLDGVPGGVALNYRNWPSRQLDEPKTEPVVRGPKEGFTEDLRVNRALLRRRLMSPDLEIETLQLGRYTQSEVAVYHLSTTVMPGLMDELRSRLSRIELDGVLESGYLEEFIEDAPFSPFSQIQNTERPDVVVAGLLEGRAAIMVDGSPSVLLVPTTFFHLMQANEDFYERFAITTLIRLIRYGLLVTALVLPALYVAITTYHQEMIPTNLLITLAAAREGIPFPAVMEALTMEMAFEALREAGLRLPRQVGQAVSIVGALVIGQAAVQAGLVSAPMVIVVALTGIASFTAPRYNAATALRLLRFPLMVAGATLGLFGVVCGLVGIAIHLAGLRSFGVPYFSPFMPFTPADWKDVLARVPHWALRTRPRLIGRSDPTRVGRGLRPGPPPQHR